MFDDISSIADSSSSCSHNELNKTFVLETNHKVGTCTVAEKNCNVYQNSVEANYMIDKNTLDKEVENLHIEPYECHDVGHFKLFNALDLDNATVYTHTFGNRSAAYYGEYSYSYSNTHHPASPFSNNPYLLKLLNYVDIAYPGIKYNSALIHKYSNGNQYIPHHSDDDQNTPAESSIITISLGESRTFEFKNIKTGAQSSLTLSHGDSLIMSKASQKTFTHGIPTEPEKGMRISITLRFITPQPDVLKSNVSTQTNCMIVDTGAEIVNDSCAYLLDHMYDGYESIDHTSIKSTNGVNNKPVVSKKISRPANKNTKSTIDTIYISSSMFRKLDARKLSSSQQTAGVFFYPGANADQILQKLLIDPNFASIKKSSIKRVFILAGTNNVDNLCHDPSQKTYVENSLNNLFYKIWCMFSNAQINIVNILPRADTSKDAVVHELNSFIYNICKAHGLKFINTDDRKNHLFRGTNGYRISELFSKGYDNVHLSDYGYSVLGKHLKYLAHNS